MTNPPDCIPSDWAYTDDFWRVRAADVMVYDHADEPAPIRLRTILTNCGVGALIGIVAVVLLFGWLPW